MPSVPTSEPAKIPDDIRRAAHDRLDAVMALYEESVRPPSWREMVIFRHDVPYDQVTITVGIRGLA